MRHRTGPERVQNALTMTMTTAEEDELKQCFVAGSRREYGGHRKKVKLLHLISTSVLLIVVVVAGAFGGLELHR